MKNYIKWVEFKKIIDIDARYKGIVLYTSSTNFYSLYINVNNVTYSTSIPKDNGVIQIDFEANYKSSANSVSNTTIVDTDVSSHGNKLKVIGSKVKIDLAAVGSSHTTLYSYNGSGKLLGCSFRFNTEKIFLKLMIDSVEIFDLDVSILDGFDIKHDDYATNILCCMVYNEKRKILTFYPRSPLRYFTNITIGAKSSENKTNKEMKYSLIELTKES